MPRDKRLEIAGGIYHVITRGIERREIFKDDDDREEFLRRLAKGLKETESKCYGWVLLPNHFHLLIRTGTKSLSELMRKILTGYAIYFNHRHKRRGYLYQNRYKSILCQEEAYLLELVRYIHLNPLRCRLVRDFDGLNKYKWSGHMVLIGNSKRAWQSKGEILERFGGKSREAIRKYLEFINDGQKTGKRADLSGGGLRRSAGGWEGVLELKRNKEYWRADERILGDGDFVSRVLKQSDEDFARREKIKQKGLDLDWLIKRVEEKTNVGKEELKQKGRANKISEAKALIAYWGYRELGITAKELMALMNCTRAALSYLVKRGEEKVKRENIILLS